MSSLTAYLKKRIKYIIHSLGIIIFSTISIELYHAYIHINYKAAIINKQIANYQVKNHQLNPQSIDFVKVLSIVNTLKIIEKISLDHSLFSHFLYTYYALKTESINTTHRSLQVLLLPRIAAILTLQLQNIHADSTILCAIVKAYLALNQHNNPNAIIAISRYEWKHQFHLSTNHLAQLTNYLKLALKQQTVTLPLSSFLTNKATKMLKTISPMQRTFNQLIFKSSISQYPNIVFNNIMEFNTIFYVKNKIIIPAIYTKKGLAHIFNVQNYKIIKDNYSDNKNNQQLEKELTTLYYYQYITTWSNVINQLTIKKNKNLTQLINTLSILTTRHSPLAKLFSIVDNNTQSLPMINKPVLFSTIHKLCKTKSPENIYNRLLKKSIKT